MRLTGFVCVFLASLTATAFADEYAPGSGSPWTAPAPVSQGRRPVDYTMYGGIDVGIPVLLDRNQDLVRPGINLHGQGGADFGFIAAFVHGGYRWIPVDFDRAAKNGQLEYQGLGRDPLRNPYFGLGVRLQVPSESPFLPYVSGSVDFNFWRFHDEELVCAGVQNWWCTEKDAYYFTPGFSGRLGLAVRVLHTLYIDFGAGVSMSFEGDFFTRNEAWVEPYFGIVQRL